VSPGSARGETRTPTS